MEERSLLVKRVPFPLRTSEKAISLHELFYGMPELSYDTFFTMVGGYVIIFSAYVVIFGD